jgi:hypothetical protein
MCLGRPQGAFFCLWLALILVLRAPVVGGESPTRYVGLFHPGVERARAHVVFRDGASKFSAFETKSQRVFTFHAQRHEHARAWHANHSEHVLGVEPVHRHVANGVVLRASIGACARTTARWGLDAIDGVSDSTYSPACVDGTAHVFVLDTGIYQHTEFGNRLGCV